jgi:hypothetical protein
MLSHIWQHHGHRNDFQSLEAARRAWKRTSLSDRLGSTVGLALMNQEHRSVIESEIRAAFRGVVLGSGVSLRQAQIKDCYADDVQGGFDQLPPEEPADDWTKVQLRNDNTDCIAHLDAEGLRYYLPALMLSVISDYDHSSMRVIGTIHSLDHRGPYGETRYMLLADRQRAVIAHFLQALPRLVQLRSEDAALVSRSLMGFWQRYL